MDWAAYQEAHGAAMQEQANAILKAEGLENSYTVTDLEVVFDVLRCGQDAYNINVAKHALRALHAPRPRAARPVFPIKNTPFGGAL